MLNIEQELEATGIYAAYEIRDPHPQGSRDDILVVKLYRNGRHYDDVYFDRKTGLLYGDTPSDNASCRLRPKSAIRPTDHFYLWAGHRDWAKDQWVKLIHEHFLAGAEAAERMKLHNSHDTLFRFMVKKEVELSPVRDYESWAAFRYETGEWTPVPWTNEPWVNPHHFAHHSVVDDCQVAFWASEANAQNDTVTVMKPGRYLQQYYGDVLTNEQIRDWAVRVDVECELKFATTPDEIYEVYSRDGAPKSCMTYKDNSACHGGSTWGSGVNPVRVYGAGDLAIAYLERRKKIIARCIVWPERKVAQRVYGDIERLVDRLKIEGYRFDADNHSAHSSNRGLFNGARLLKMVPERYPNNLIAPYFDFGYRLDVGPEFLVMNNTGALHANHTDGLLYQPSSESEDEGTFTCDRCADETDESDHHDVNGSSWCEHCYDHYAFNCDCCNNTFSDHQSNSVGGSSYCDDCYSVQTRTCDYCSDRVEITEPIYDAHSITAETPRGSGDVIADACSDCVDGDETIQRGLNGDWVDTCNATLCEDCDVAYSDRLEACPTPQLENA